MSGGFNHPCDVCGDSRMTVEGDSCPVCVRRGRGLDPTRIWRVRMATGDVLREWWIEADDYEKAVALLEGLYLIPLGVERKGAEFVKLSQIYD